MKISSSHRLPPFWHSWANKREKNRCENYHNKKFIELHTLFCKSSMNRGRSVMRFDWFRCRMYQLSIFYVWCIFPIYANSNRCYWKMNTHHRTVWLVHKSIKNRLGSILILDYSIPIFYMCSMWHPLVYIFFISLRFFHIHKGWIFLLLILSSAVTLLHLVPL